MAIYCQATQDLEIMCIPDITRGAPSAILLLYGVIVVQSVICFIEYSKSTFMTNAEDKDDR